MAHRPRRRLVTPTDGVTQTIDSPSWATTQPRLSILVPFFRNDPTPLLEAFAGPGATERDVEIVVLDDGGGDDDLFARVASLLVGSTLAARLLRLAQNQGRARGRNLLAGQARGRHLLFVDSDMLPGGSDFVANWMDVVARHDPPAVVGGFRPPSGAPAPAHRLHAAVQAQSECASAAKRRLTPEKHVFTSNLLVRRDVFETEAFDTAFAGWGWEDVEWGIRVAARYGVMHIDNPAIHTGLDDATTLLEKYGQSQANYRRILQGHRAILQRYPGYKLARLVRAAPCRKALRRLLRNVVLRETAPLPLRIAALRGYRAALYAEVVE